METMKEFQMIDKRTAAGVYPAGGNDGNNFTAISGAAALSLGQRIRYHVLLSSSIDFMRAEAALFGGTGTAKFI
jgi:hypothetical protein